MGGAAGRRRPAAPGVRYDVRVRSNSEAFVLEAAFWGFVAGSALLCGAGLGLRLRFTQREIGLVMAFGAGTLISSLTFELTLEAYNRAGLDAVAAGLPLGALAFFAGDWLIDRWGGKHRKRSSGKQAEGNGAAIMLGAVLDGIPESAVIGISLLGGTGVGVAFVAAVFISNLPEGLSASIGMRKAGHTVGFILGSWAVVVAASAVAAALGYGLLGGASQHVVAATQAFAAGAILTMLADTMMPEAFEEAGPVVGLVTVLGYATGALLTAIA
jgi:zinc transporter, ZIP family